MDKGYKMGFVVPNQLPIKIKRYPILDGRYTSPRDQFIKVNRWSMQYALRNLTPNGFKVWMWFVNHRADEEFPLMRQSIMNECGISKNTYLKCIRELRENDYIVDAKLHENFYGYIFIEEGPLRFDRNYKYPEEM